MRPKFEDLKELHDDACHDPWYVNEGNRMIEWIENKMNEWNQDEKIIWKASVQHHPLFAKHYTDYDHLISTYLPILIQHKFDMYLNGHEHALEHAIYPMSDESFLDANMEPPSQLFNFKLDMVQRNFKKFSMDIYKYFTKNNDETCQNDVEKIWTDSRFLEIDKGKVIHQVTTGSTGYDLYDLCLDQETMGEYKYVQNKLHGFTKLHVDAEKAILTLKGVDENTKEIRDLYTVQINNRKNVQ